MLCQSIVKRGKKKFLSSVYLCSATSRKIIFAPVHDRQDNATDDIDKRHQDDADAADYHADSDHPVEGEAEVGDNRNNQDTPGSDQVVRVEGSAHVDRGDLVDAPQGHDPSVVACLDDACWDPFLPLMEVEDIRVLCFPPPWLFSPLHRQSSCHFVCRLLSRSIVYPRVLVPIDGVVHEK